MRYDMIAKGLGLSLVLLALGCSTSQRIQVINPETLPRPFEPPSGVVEYIWEEPMVDVVEVPPGLDPEGHYYRPAHQAIVEIRQGRWKYHKKEAQEKE